MYRWLIDKVTAMPPPSYFATALLILSLSVALKKVRKNKLPLPPGPKKIPLLGNLLDIPKQNEWLTYHRWCKDLSEFPSLAHTAPSRSHIYRFGNHTRHSRRNVNGNSGYRRSGRGAPSETLFKQLWTVGSLLSIEVVLSST
jgi:hypothetical protein